MQHVRAPKARLYVTRPSLHDRQVHFPSIYIYICALFNYSTLSVYTEVSLFN